MKPKIIKVPFDKLKKIIHLGDAHIRLVRRHGEYRDVFQNLYEKLVQSNLENSIIFFAGDLCHAKVDMSPEMVRLASDFLRSLSEIAPTIVIAGNHDCNLGNSDRLDALSPIIENIDSDNLHYLRNSGVYKIADTEFGVFSVFGDKKKWPTADQLTSKNKIALFHGPINNATTDVGYTITNRHAMPSIFAGYSAVLCGDIHSHQTLQQYNPELGQPIIVYCGSLVQQNHGESLKGHGYCEWNIPARKFKFKEISNACGFYTALIEDGKMPDLIGVPDNVRLRLYVSNTEPSVVTKICAMIRKKINVQELTINRVISNDTLSNSSSHLLDGLSNVREVPYQNTLIKNYLTTHFADVDDNMNHRIEDINALLNSKIPDDETNRNIYWEPLEFTFSNMFCYGENNKINFKDMAGIYGLFAGNAHGKTAAIDALMFTLFDKTPRAFKASHIMNNRKKKFECFLKFKIGEEVFGIKRTGIRNKKGEVKVDVEFWKEDGKNIVSLNGEDRRDTDANIRLYIGNYDDFILTNISIQNNGALFVDKSQSERKDLLGQFMGINIFDKLYMLALDEIKEIAGVIKKFSRGEFTENLAAIQTKIETQLVIYGEFEEKLSNKTLIKENLDAAIRKLFEKKIPIHLKETDIKKLQSKFSSLQLSSSEADNKLVELTDQIAGVEKSLNTEKESLSKYDLKKLKILEKEYTDINCEIIKKLNEFDILNIEIKNKEEKLSHLKEYEYDPNCKFCINNVFVKDAKKTELELKDDLKLQSTTKKYLEDLQHKFKSLDSVPIDLKNVKNLDGNISHIKLQKERLISSLRGVENKKTEYSLDIRLVQEAIKKYEENETAIEKNAEIQSEIDELALENEMVSNEFQKIQSSLRKLYGELEVLKSSKSEMIKAINDSKELEETYKAYEFYISAVNRDGVPYEIISKVIPNIESEINNILTQIVDFTVVLQVDGKNINGKLVYDMDKVWPLELSSGMERFISSLAIRVALINISNLPKSNFLVVDEGLGTLDADNLSSMSMMFNILKSKFSFVILVSHLDSIRDIVDNLIDIKKDRGFSQINVS